jgi:four helix bundle protein
MMNPTSFTTLDVYKECRILRKNISLLVKTHFPASEQRKLTDQILRSSRSITACVAEGYGRYHYQETIQYCRMSRGSLMETLEHLITAFDETYISSEELLEFKTHIDKCGQLLNGYINYLKKAKIQ